MNKIKIVFSSNFFAVTAMAEYVLRALKRRDDVEVWTIGPYFGINMPWGVVSVVPDKYIFKPDVELPAMPIGSELPISMAEARLPEGFIPDIWLTIDSGFRWIGKPKDGKNIVYYSDPHVLRDWYNKNKSNYDYVFNPQTSYILPDEIYLPYAADKEWHSQIALSNGFIYDVCIIGNYYPQRLQLIDRLRAMGLNCFFQLGIAKEDAREIINQSKISVNWSSMQDLTARVFEVLGCGTVLLANRVPDLQLFEENKEFYGFDTMDEAINKVKYILDHFEEAKSVADNGHKAIIERGHYWDDRVKVILEKTGVLENV